MKNHKLSFCILMLLLISARNLFSQTLTTIASSVTGAPINNTTTYPSCYGSFNVSINFDCSSSCNWPNTGYIYFEMPANFNRTSIVITPSAGVTSNYSSANHRLEFQNTSGSAITSTVNISFTVSADGTGQCNNSAAPLFKTFTSFNSSTESFPFILQQPKLQFDISDPTYPSNDSKYYLKFSKNNERYYKIVGITGRTDYFILNINPEEEIKITNIQVKDASGSWVSLSTTYPITHVTSGYASQIIFNSSLIQSFIGHNYINDDEELIVREIFDVESCTIDAIALPSKYELKVQCDESNASDVCGTASLLQLNINCKEKPSSYATSEVKYENISGTQFIFNPNCPAVNEDLNVVIDNKDLLPSQTIYPWRSGTKLIKKIVFAFSSDFFSWSAVKIGNTTLSVTTQVNAPITLVTIDLDAIHFATDPDGPDGITDGDWTDFEFPQVDDPVLDRAYVYLPEGKKLIITFTDFTFTCNSKLQSTAKLNDLQDFGVTGYYNGKSPTVFGYNMCDFENSYTPPTPLLSNHSTKSITNGVFQGVCSGVSDQTDLALGVYNTANLKFSFTQTSVGITPWSMLVNKVAPNVFNCPDERNYAVITMPTPIVINPGSVVKVREQSAAPGVYLPNVNVTNISPTQLQIDWDSSIPNTINPISVDIEIVVGLACNGTSGFRTVEAEFRTKCDNDCPTCYRLVGKAEVEYFIHCGGTCDPDLPVGSLVSTVPPIIVPFTFNRITQGWNESTSIVDGEEHAFDAGQLVTSTTENNKVYEGDIIKAVAYGTCGFNKSWYRNPTLFFEVQYEPKHGNNIFEYINNTSGNYIGTFKFTEVGNPTHNFTGHAKFVNFVTMLPTPPNDPGKDRIIITPDITDPNFVNLYSTGTADNIIDAEYTIEFIGYFKVADQVATQYANGFYPIPQVRGDFTADYEYWIDHPDTPEVWEPRHRGSCDPYGDEITFLKLRHTVYTPKFLDPSWANADAGWPGAVEQCILRFQIETSIAGGYLFLDDFTNEVRPFIKWPDVVKFRIKTNPSTPNSAYMFKGFAIRKESHTNIYNFPLREDYLSTDPDFNLYVTHTPSSGFPGYEDYSIHLDILSTLKGINWQVVDKFKYARQQLTLLLNRQCPKEDSDLELLEFPITEFAQSDFANVNLNSTLLTTYSYSNTDEDYEINITNPTSPILHPNSNPYTFPITLTHKDGIPSASGSGITNVWIYFTDINGIVIDNTKIEVKKVFGSGTILINPTSNVYQLGATDNQGSETDYQDLDLRIKYTYDCPDPDNPEVRIFAHYGNSCFGYPLVASNGTITFPNGACDRIVKETEFILQPNTVAVDLQVPNPVHSTVSECEKAIFDAQVESLDPGDAIGTKLQVTIPSGFSFNNLNCTYSWNNGTATFSGAIPASLISSSSNLLTIDVHQLFVQQSLGIPAGLFITSLPGQHHPVIIHLEFNHCHVQNTSNKFTFELIEVKDLCLEYLDVTDYEVDQIITVLTNEWNATTTLEQTTNCADPIPFTINLTGLNFPQGVTGKIAVKFNPLFTLDHVNTFPLPSTLDPLSALATWDIAQITDPNFTISGFFLPPPDFCGEFSLLTICDFSPLSCCSSLEIHSDPISICCQQNGYCMYIPKPEKDDYSQSIITTSDGGYAVAGTMHQDTDDKDLYMVKFDNNLSMDINCLLGDKIGEKPYPEIANSIIRRGDFYYLTGTVSYSETDHDILVSKLDLAGQIIWSKRFGEKDKIEEGMKIIDLYPLCSDHILIVGFTNAYEDVSTNYDMVALQLRTNGSVAKYKIFGSNGLSEKAYDAVLLSGIEGCVIAGEITDNGNTDVMAVKIDGKIGLQSSLIVHGDQNETAYGVTYIHDNVFLAGKTSSFGNGGDDVYLIKTDFALSGIQSTSTYGQSNNEMAYSINKTANNKLILCGTVESGKKDGLVMNIDPGDNTVIWSRRTNFIEKDEEFYCVTESPEQDILATGYYQVNGDDKDLFISRLSSDGESCCLENYEMPTRDGGEALSGCEEQEKTPSKVNFGLISSFYEEEILCGSIEGGFGERTVSTIKSHDSTDKDFFLQPNPLNTTTTLTIPSNLKLTNARIIIYDLLGNLVKEINSINNHSVLINCTNFPSGIYLLKFLNEGQNKFHCKMNVE